MLAPGQEISLRVDIGQPLAKTQILQAIKSEIAQVDCCTESAYVCTGDGSNQAMVAMLNTSQTGLRLSRGAPVCWAEVVDGCIHATADQETGELTHVDDPLANDFDLPPVPEHRFSRLEWLPMCSIKVVILFSGIGGVEMGLREAQTKYGLSFRVVLAIDINDQANGIHRETFPDTPVVKHKLGVSYDATLKVIEKYLPREEWWLSYWHASPSSRTLR